MNATYLTHNDDGKQKWQSHTVSIHDDAYQWPCIEGYGSTKEEALAAFKTNLKELRDYLNKIYEDVDAYKITNPTNTLTMYEVDYAGRIMDE